KKLMLIAHMDTVYQRGILATQAYRVDGNRIYGPGIADDKGGIAVILHSLKILGEAGWRDYAKLTVLFNPDEEVGSIGSGELIAEIADQHDVVLSCEPTAAAPVAKNDSLLLGGSRTETVVKIVPGRPPFVANDRGRALARDGQAIYAEIERTLDIVEMTGGATDAGYANRSGKAIVVESFGLAGWGYHARDEYIDSGSIVPRLYLMTRMLTELGKKQ